MTDGIDRRGPGFLLQNLPDDDSTVAQEDFSFGATPYDSMFDDVFADVTFDDDEGIGYVGPFQSAFNLIGAPIERGVRKVAQNAQTMLNTMINDYNVDDVQRIAEVISDVEEKLNKETKPRRDLGGPLLVGQFATVPPPRTNSNLRADIEQRLRAGEDSRTVAEDLLFKNIEQGKEVRNRYVEMLANSPKESVALAAMLDTPDFKIEEAAALFTEENFPGLTDILADSFVPSMMVGITAWMGGAVAGSATAAVTKNPTATGAAARVGAGVAGGLVSYALETKFALAEYMLDNEVDITDPMQVYDFATKNGDKLQEIITKSRQRGAGTAVFDAFAIGSGGALVGSVVPRVLANTQKRVAIKAIGAMAATSLAELGLQGLYGAAGVIAGNWFAEGDASFTDEAALEMIGELVGGGFGEISTGFSAEMTGRMIAVINDENLTPTEKKAVMFKLFKQQSDENIANDKKPEGPPKADPITGETEQRGPLADVEAAAKAEGKTVEEYTEAAEAALLEQEQTAVDEEVARLDAEQGAALDSVMEQVGQEFDKTAKPESPATATTGIPELAGVELPGPARFVPRTKAVSVEETEGGGKVIITESKSGKAFGRIEVDANGQLVSAKRYRNLEDAQTGPLVEDTGASLTEAQTLIASDPTLDEDTADARADALLDAEEALAAADTAELENEADNLVEETEEEKYIRNWVEENREQYEELDVDEFRTQVNGFLEQFDQPTLPDSADFMQIMRAWAAADYSTATPEQIAETIEAVDVSDATEREATAPVTRAPSATEPDFTELDAIEKEIKSKTTSGQTQLAEEAVPEEEITDEEGEFAEDLLAGIGALEEEDATEADAIIERARTATTGVSEEKAAKKYNYKPKSARGRLIENLRNLLGKPTVDGRRIESFTKKELRSLVTKEINNQYKPQDEQDSDLLEQMNDARSLRIMSTENGGRLNGEWAFEGVDRDGNFLVVFNQKYQDGDTAKTYFTWNPFTRQTSFLHAESASGKAGRPSISDAVRDNGLRARATIMKFISAATDAVIQDPDYASPARGFGNRRYPRLKEIPRARSLQEGIDKRTQEAERGRFNPREGLEANIQKLTEAQGVTERLLREANEAPLVDASDLVPDVANAEAAGAKTYMTEEQYNAVKNSETLNALAVQILPDGTLRHIRFRAGTGVRGSSRDSYTIDVEAASTRTLSLDDRGDVGPRPLEQPVRIGSIPADGAKLRQVAETLPEKEYDPIGRTLTPLPKDTAPGTGVTFAEEQLQERRELLANVRSRKERTEREIAQLEKDEQPVPDDLQERLDNLLEREAVLLEELVDDAETVRREQMEQRARSNAPASDSVKARLKSVADAAKADWDNWDASNSDALMALEKKRTAGTITKKELDRLGRLKAVRQRLWNRLSQANTNYQIAISNSNTTETDRYVKIPGKTPEEVGVSDNLNNSTFITTEDGEVFVNPDSLVAMWTDVRDMIGRRGYLETDNPEWERLEITISELVSGLKATKKGAEKKRYAEDIVRLLQGAPNSDAVSALFARMGEGRKVGKEEAKAILAALGQKVSGSMPVLIERITEASNALTRSTRQETGEAKIETAADFLETVDPKIREKLEKAVSEDAMVSVAKLMRLRDNLMKAGYSWREATGAIKQQVESSDQVEAAAKAAWGTILELVDNDPSLYASGVTAPNQQQFREEMSRRDQEVDDAFAEEVMRLENDARLRALLRSPTNEIGRQLRDLIVAGAQLTVPEANAFRDAYRDVREFAQTPDFLRPPRQQREGLRATRERNVTRALDETAVSDEERALDNIQQALQREETRPTLGLPEGVQPRQANDTLATVNRSLRRNRNRPEGSPLAIAFEEAVSDSKLAERVREVARQESGKPPTTRNLTSEEEATLVDDDLNNVEKGLKDDDNDSGVILDPMQVSAFGLPNLSTRAVARRLARFMMPWLNRPAKKRPKDLRPTFERALRRAKGRVTYIVENFRTNSLKLAAALESAGLVDTPEKREKVNRALAFFVENGEDMASTIRNYGIVFPPEAIAAIKEMNRAKSDLSVRISQNDLIKSYIRLATTKRGKTYLHRQVSRDVGLIEKAFGGQWDKVLSKLPKEERDGLIAAAIKMYGTVLDPDVLNAMPIGELREMFQAGGIFHSSVRNEQLDPNKLDRIPSISLTNGFSVDLKGATKAEMLDAARKIMSNPLWQQRKDALFVNSINQILTNIISPARYSNDAFNFTGERPDTSIQRTRNFLLSERDRIEGLTAALQNTGGQDTAALRSALRRLKKSNGWNTVLSMSSDEYLQMLATDPRYGVAGNNVAAKHLYKFQLMFEVNNRLRKALGEVTDPSTLLTDTARRMADTLELNDFINTVINTGIKEGFVVIGDKPEGWEAIDSLPRWFNRPARVAALAEATIEIDDARGGQIGLREEGQPRIWVDPEFRIMIQDLLGVSSAVDSNVAMNALRHLTGLAKLDKVLFNPLSHLRNAASSLFIGVFNGMYTYGIPFTGERGPIAASSAIGVRQAGGALSSGLERASDASIENDLFLRGLREQVTTRGILYDGARLGALTDVYAHVQSLSAQDQLHLLSGNTWVAGQGGRLVNAVEATKAGNRTVLNRLKTVAGEWFRLEDEVMKIAGFLTRTEQFADALGLDNAREKVAEFLRTPQALTAAERDTISQAMDMAEENVLATLPTFSRAHRRIKQLSRNTLMGAFPTFHWEMVRNNFEQIKFMTSLLITGKGPMGVQLNKTKARKLALKLGALYSLKAGLYAVGLPALSATALAKFGAKKADITGADEDEGYVEEMMDMFLHNRNMGPFRSLLPKYKSTESASVFDFGDGEMQVLEWGYTAAEGALIEAFYKAWNDIRELDTDPRLSEAGKLRAAKHILSSTLYATMGVFAGEEVFITSFEDFFDQNAQPPSERYIINEAATALNQGIRSLSPDGAEDPVVAARLAGAAAAATLENVPGTTAARWVQRVAENLIETGAADDPDWVELAMDAAQSATGLRVIDWSVEKDYPGMWKHEDKANLGRVTNELTSLFDPNVEYRDYEEFKAEHDILEQYRRDAFSGQMDKFLAMQTLGATRQDILQAVAEGNGGKLPEVVGQFTVENFFTGEYEPAVFKETHPTISKYREAFVEDNNEFEYTVRRDWYARAQAEFGGRSE